MILVLISIITRALLIMTVKCHEFFNCKRTKECPYFSTTQEKYCWEVPSEQTPFIALGSGELQDGEKEIVCQNCLYYKHIKCK